jgi:zinc transport system substrate-binding protein
MKHFFSLTLVVALLAACSANNPTPTSPAANQDPAPNAAVNDAEPSTEKIVVATSFYPLTHLAQQVGGDLVTIQQVAKVGVDPHAFEPSPKDVQQMFESDLLIFNGQGVDAYAADIHEELQDSGVRVLSATELVETIAYEEGGHDDHDDHGDDHGDEEHDDHDDHEDEHDDHHDEDDDHDEHGDEHHDEDEHDDHGDEEHDEHEEDGHEGHNHGEWDPHVWLDPLRSELIVQAIAKELGAIRPEQAEQFQANADAYAAQLRSLDADMQAGLKNCNLDAVIVSHDAYRYLANRYNFATLEIAGLSPNIAPSPARLAELTKIAEAEGIAHVFFETQVSPALSETLAQEIGASTLVLHSLEALSEAERQAGKTYIDLQRMNLENLRTALQCS